MYENLILTIKLCSIIAGMALINTILGCLQAGTAGDWSWKKFIFGILKAICLIVCIGGFCVILTVVPEVFTEAGIEVSEEMITVVQVFIVLGATIKKYATDVYDKIMEILNS